MLIGPRVCADTGTCHLYVRKSQGQLQISYPAHLHNSFTHIRTCVRSEVTEVVIDPNSNAAAEVEVSQPTSEPVVESHPLQVSAQVRYRLHPGEH
jgi:hypothetical protein